MHPVGQQQQRRGNTPRMPLMYQNNLPPGPLLPPPTLRYGGISTYQQSTSGSGGGGGMKHHQSRGGNRGGRGSIITHRQQRPTTNSRYHPYPFRQPLPPQQQQRYRPAQPPPRTPVALMGTPPGMSQSEYELIHSAQVQRDKKKLDVLAPSNTTQFLIRDHNRQTTPSSIATPTPTHQTNSSPSATQNQPSLPYDQMFEMNEVDAQSDDTESNQDLGFGGVDPSVDNDFNDIYYQCRYERYAAFSRANLLNEVLSLCANIDRLQHEKSEVEKRLRDVQQHIYNSTSTSNGGSQGRSTTEETNQTNDDDSRMQSPLHDQQQNDSVNVDDINPISDELQASTSSQPIVTEEKDNNDSVGGNSSKSNETEQQIVHD